MAGKNDIITVFGVCFQLAKRAMGCASIELVPRKRSTSWPPCLEVGVDESAIF